MLLAVEIERVFEASNSIYGYRKVTAQLKAEEIYVCERTVAKIMAELGLESCHPQPWRHMNCSTGC